MANKSGMQVLFFGSTKRTGFGSKVAGPLMTAIINEELNKRVPPEINAAYDKMTEVWSEKPTPKIKVGQRKNVGNFVEVRFTADSNANKKWLMVDTQGRAGGANIVKKIKYLDPLPTSSERFTVSGRGFKAKRLAVGAGFTPVFETKKMGQTTQVRGFANRPPLRFQAGYDPRTSAPGKFGGPGTRGDPWVTKLQVRQGAVEPRFLSRENVLTALAGKPSPLNSIITPWLSDSGPTRAAYRKAFAAITGRRI